MNYHLTNARVAQVPFTGSEASEATSSLESVAVWLLPMWCLCSPVKSGHRSRFSDCGAGCLAFDRGVRLFQRRLCICYMSGLDRRDLVAKQPHSIAGVEKFNVSPLDQQSIAKAPPRS